MSIIMEPIGYVRNDHPPGHKPETWQGTRSRLELEGRWTEALSGLDDFSHVIVLCYLHLAQDQSLPAQIHPQGNREMPLTGFFGTRTPVRPNPISLTVVPLLGREGSTLYVQNLDMYDGTPVLDVKPYLIRGDCQPDAHEPEWIHRLRALNDQRRRAQNT